MSCTKTLGRLNRTLIVIVAVLVAAPGAWPQDKYKTLYRFGGTGGGPYADLILDQAGNLYGTTRDGGTDGYGTVFKLTRNDAGSWSERVLHSFTNGPDGSNPVGGVISDAAGNLYGTASAGGSSASGVVYELKPSNGGWTETVLHTFGPGRDGSGPFAGLIFDSSSNLYGTTVYGGASGDGVVYELHANGLETVLHSFISGPDGANPYAGLTGDASGNLYGTTYFGGPSNAGVVYKVNLATKHETVLYIFSGANGANPESGVIIDSAGNMYGTTVNGGAANAGEVYELNPIGQETLLHSFTGGTDGANPVAALIRDSAGNLYGTASNGGNSLTGVVFALDPAVPQK